MSSGDPESHARVEIAKLHALRQPLAVAGVEREGLQRLPGRHMAG
ncbi:hypothetical protein [Reyranella sp.]